MSKNSHSAPGQALGYYFQLERALGWLSKMPVGSTVGIETEDDVCITLLNGQQILEQDKSSIDSYPFIPSKKDLWKTLNIWLNSVKDNVIDLEKTTFYMVTNKANNHSIAYKLGKAETEQEIKAVYDELKQAAFKQNGEDVLKHIAVFNTFSEIEVKNLIQRIKYEGGNGVFGEALRIIIIGDLQLDNDEYANGIVDEVLGWTFKVVTDAWRKNAPANINRDDFIRHKNTVIQNRKNIIINKLIYEIGDITSDKYESQKSNTYVQQLKLINKKDRDIKNAIFEYLASVYARTILPDKGYLTGSDLDDFDENLKSFWKNTFDSTSALYSHLAAENIGTAIFAETMKNQIKLTGFESVNTKLNSGSLHCMADNKTIGWHPDFEKLL